MRRLALWFTALLLAGSSLAAQSSILDVTVSTQPSGARFAVDGETYTSAQLFLWPIGSKHLLQFIGGPPPPGINASGIGSFVQFSPDGGALYTFGSWADDAGLLNPGTSPVITVSADPRVRNIVAGISVLYRLEIVFAGVPDAVAPCGTLPAGIPLNASLAGLISAGTTCVWGTTALYVTPGILNLNAVAFPGYAFAGWLYQPYASSRTLNISAPVTLYASFVRANRVRFLTSPLGWPVIVDSVQVPTLTTLTYTGPCPNFEALPKDVLINVTPMCFGDFDFLPGSPHIISAPSPHFDSHAKPWAFTGWSGTARIQNGVYTASPLLGTGEVVTANYSPAAQVSFVTSPAGLGFSVDGLNYSRQTSFYWPIGAVHQFSAPLQQTGADKRVYNLQGWSNGGPASQTFTVDQTEVLQGLTLTANYQVVSRLIVNSSPSGLPLQVGGQSCQTPCTFDHPAGTQVTVAAPQSITPGPYTRMDFTGWSDGGAATHSVTLNSNTLTLTANYLTHVKLVLISEPAGAAVFVVTPPSADSFYLAGTVVHIRENDPPGSVFIAWGGALSGTFPSGAVTMNGPQTVIAHMQTVPYLGPSAVLNAAGATPVKAVAPGSAISIFGVNLAAHEATASSSPLPQSLGGVTVTVEDHILALLFVSPRQINAVLPPGLYDGSHALVVDAAGSPSVAARFTVARNAPGLLPQVSGPDAYVTAFHSGGTPVSLASPAASGETITILGSGFGPCKRDPVYGFATPSTPLDPLIDPAVVTLGALPLTPAWIGCAPGYFGLDSLQLAVPAGLPTGTTLPLTVEVNGMQSNTVLLPLE